MLKKQPRYAILSAALALTVASLACNGGAAATQTPTQPPAATHTVAPR